MSAQSLEAVLTELREAAGGDPIEAAECAGELVVGQVRDVLAVIASSDTSRVAAMAAVLEAMDRIVTVLEEAMSPGRTGRVHVLALVELLCRSLDRVAPAAARELVDPDARVRSAAARATRAFLDAPAVARCARAAAAYHPDPAVRTVLAPRAGTRPV